ncbi:MAG: hypothetical protein P8J20_06655 [Novosphingobium sp.]|nr:hypothetical protein [Novosphingobium sp.]
MTNISHPIRPILLATAAMLVPASPAHADGTAPCNTNGTGGSISLECGVNSSAAGTGGATAVGATSNVSGGRATSIGTYSEATSFGASALGNSAQATGST